MPEVYQVTLEAGSSRSDTRDVSGDFRQNCALKTSS